MTLKDIEELNFSVEDTLHLLYIAKKYDVPRIQINCQEYLRTTTTLENACYLYESLDCMNEDQLRSDTFKFIAK